MTRITIERLEELIADVDGELVPGCSEWSQIHLKLRADKLAALRELRAYRKEGWVLVPKEPTGAMLGLIAGEYDDGPKLTRDQALIVYRAMLAAAPEPQEEP